MAKEAALSQNDEDAFTKIAELAYRESGLILVAEKFLMVQSRLRPRVKSLGFGEFSEYQQFVCSESGRSERRHMISALTTNVSHFFRESHHFDILVESISHRINSNISDRIRIWSAGCSNGQEAVSASISLLENVQRISNYDVKILATDIDPEVVSFARQGAYPKRMISGLPDHILEKYFERQKDGNDYYYFVSNDVKRMISFKELNLLSDWPMKHRFDAVFCRNVVIYFDAKTQAKLWPRFLDNLRDDGVFFLGHSERIGDPEAVGFSSIGPTAYCKMENRMFWESTARLEAKNGVA